MIHVLDGEQYYHIKEFASLTGLSIQAVRYLCFTGNAARKMKCTYEGSRLYILASELTKYPFTKGGHTPILQGIYHYRYNDKEGKWERYQCQACSDGQSYDHDENMQHMSTLETNQ